MTGGMIMADRVVQDIKDKLDIVDVVGSYIQLKRAGVNWKANCPFHNEKSPSFNVNPSRQIWHCFGCGEGGDVFSFVQKYEHLEFPEALKVLADKAGVVLPERVPGSSAEEARQREARERVYRVNSFATKFYNQILLSRAGVKALGYLEKRGLTKETIDTWQIGYAPDDYQLLEKSLLGKGARTQDLVLAGVSGQSARGTYDRFRGRITFPILDFAGQVVGFSARILEDLDVAKYINSPESPVYSKSRVLFGLYQARTAIRVQDYLALVEGQMDCIKAYQAGFLNTVATSGTAVTVEQLKLISRLTKNITLCFDSDDAGQRAAKKAGMLALAQGFAVKYLQITGGKDPDELISQSPELWRGALKGSVWFVEHYIQEAEQKYLSRSVEQQKYVTREVLPLIALLTDPLEQDRYVQMVVERFGFSKPVVATAIGQSHSNGAITTRLVEVPNQENPVEQKTISTQEKRVLGILLSNESLMLEWEQLGGSPKDFSSVEVASLLTAKKAGMQDVLDTSTLASEAMFMLESVQDNQAEDAADSLQGLQNSIYIFRLGALKNQLMQVTADIRTAEANKNANLLSDLQREFAKLSSERLNLERKIQSM